MQKEQYEIALKNTFALYNDNIKILPECNSIRIQNTGTINIILNELWVITPGDSFISNADSSSYNVIDTTEYFIRFDNPVPGPQRENAAVVIESYYTKRKKIEY